MLAFIRALLGSLIIALGLLQAQFALAQDVDPFALLFGTEDPNIDVDDEDGAGFDDLNIITLHLRELTLDEGFMAYRSQGGLCLPFGPTMEAFEFPIDVSDDGMAEGWFIDTRRTIEIDFEAELALLSDEAVPLPDSPFLNTVDGWCATLDTLSTLFPIEFDYQERNLRVVATPLEILPIEAKLEREAFREDALRAKPRRYEEFPIADNPHRWLSWPVADVGVDVRASSGGKVAVNFDLEAAGDMLNTTGRIRTVGGTQAGILDNLRVTLGRTNPDPEELGPLKARRFDLGDISTPNLPLVSRSMNGAGVVITNRSAFRADLFDTTEIRGPLPKGWEAELYEGQQLLAFLTEPDSNGDYVFENVPLRSGFNRFTIKLFGPFGETEEREVKYFVGAELEPENETSYFLGVVDSRTPVVEAIGLASADADAADEAEDEDVDIASLFDGNLSDPFDDVDEDEGDGQRLIGSVSHGLTDKLTVRIDGTLDLGDLKSGDHSAVVSMASSVAGGYAVGRVASDGRGLPAVEAAFQRRIFENSNLSLRAVAFGDLENEITGRGAGRTMALGQIRGNSSLAIGRRNVPIQASVNYARSADGSTYLDAASRASLSHKRYRFTKSFNFSQSSGGDTTDTSLGGSLLFARKSGNMRILGGLGYSLHDGVSLDQVGLSAQRSFGQKSTASLTLSHSMDVNSTSLSANWSRSFDRVRLSTSAGIDDQMDWTLGMRLGFSLAKEKDHILPSIARGQDLTRSGRIEGQVFIDDNLNGLFDEGEQAIEDAQLLVNGAMRDERTDEDGVVFLDKMNTHEVQNISINLSTVDDPFLIAAVPGTAVLPRPGQTFTIPIALQQTGDIEGTLTVIDGEHSFGAGGVPVQVADKTGRVVAETTTDFDGYFYLDKLPLRDLVLRVANESVEDMAVVSEDLPFTLTLDEPSIFGADLKVFVD